MNSSAIVSSLGRGSHKRAHSIWYQNFKFLDGVVNDKHTGYRQRQRLVEQHLLKMMRSAL